MKKSTNHNSRQKWITTLFVVWIGWWVQSITSGKQNIHQKTEGIWAFCQKKTGKSCWFDVGDCFPWALDAPSSFADSFDYLTGKKLQRMNSPHHETDFQAGFADLASIWFWMIICLLRSSGAASQTAHIFCFRLHRYVHGSETRCHCSIKLMETNCLQKASASMFGKRNNRSDVVKTPL